MAKKGGEGMLVTLEEVKIYLRLDGNNENALITSLINTSQELCESILRVELAALNPIPETVKTAILYGVAFLYENREQAEYSDLINTLRSLLFGLRNEAF